MASGDIYFLNGHGPLIMKMYDSKIDCVQSLSYLVQIAIVHFLTRVKVRGRPSFSSFTLMIISISVNDENDGWPLS